MNSNENLYIRIIAELIRSHGGEFRLPAQIMSDTDHTPQLRFADDMANDILIVTIAPPTEEEKRMETKVLKMRARHEAKESIHDIARSNGMDLLTACRVVKRKIWRHVK